MPTIEGTTLLHVFLVIRQSAEQKQFVRSLFSHITNTRNENVLRCRQGWIQNVGNGMFLVGVPLPWVPELTEKKM